MKILLSIIVSFVLCIKINLAYITWIAPRLWLQTPPSPPGSPWPMPQNMTQETQQFTFDPASFTIISNMVDCNVMDAAIQRYTNWMVLDENAVPDPDLEIINELVVDVENWENHCGSDYYPHDFMNERYEIEINPTEENRSFVIRSHSMWGGIRGLETFSQLIHLSESNTYVVNKTMIYDFPRFSYRGVMIDTARHYLPINVIEDIIEAMSFDKFNVLHWHMVDDQAFPFESSTFPNMSLYGAYTPNHVYTRQNIQDVIEYAKLYGIRVVPEFDTPGHTYSWGKGLPDLLTPCWGDGEEGGPYVPSYGVHADMETVNPSQEYTYSVMQALWEEIVQLFPDEFVHLGLDEAYYSCWQSNPNISSWMVDMGFTEYYEVEEYYAERITGIVLGLNASIITWQDPLENGVTLDINNTRIAVWKEDWKNYMLQVTELGYNAYLLSPWYLNYISYGQDWREYYEVEPHNFTENAELQERVLGGSVAMWAEYIDSTNILDNMWPRASAVAERLWSAKDVNDTDEAAYRLDQQRCRIIRSSSIGGDEHKSSQLNRYECTLIIHYNRAPLSIIRLSTRPTVHAHLHVQDANGFGMKYKCSSFYQQ